ncbi:MAG: TonB-dependent receptor [Bacteroidota bacterium]|nr:TonB-dependent receptor [Bacteroidota bacterium]
MKFSLTLLLSFAISFSLLAQSKFINYKVSGQIVEKLTGKGVPYVTVTLRNDSTKERKVQATDGSGRFALNLKAPRKYNLSLSAIGYKAVTMPVKVTDANTDLGKLTLEEGIEIKEVTVTAQKPLVRVDVDKIVYSMETDPEAQTNNALEMLRKVPLITVDAEENITLNGQSNFKVLVNGKSSSMMSKNLKDVLKSFPANTIKDIEVITNPSSKYDAEGVGGIINIITLKKTMSGYNGSLSAGMDSRGSFNGSTYLATKIDKFSFSTRIFGNQYKQPGAESAGSGEYFNNTDYHFLTNSGKTTYKGNSFSFSGEASYDIDSLNLISMSFWGYTGSSKNEGWNSNEYQNLNHVVSRSYFNTRNGKNSYGSLSGNIDYQKTYKKPDKSLTFSYKLDNNPNTSNNSTVVTGLTNYQSYTQRSKNDALGREQTLQIDYYDPLTKMHQIEGGAKLILRQNTSNSETYRDEVKQTNGNDLDYDQYILGAYAGYVFKWKKLSTKTGVRLERTWNDGVSKSSGSNTDFKNRLFNLVPYITISYMPKQGQTFKASYTQRLSRPGIWYLNPYLNNVDSMNVSQGNPSLKSEVSHAFELGYNLYTPKFNLSVSSTASFVNNSIEQITTIQPNGATFSTYKNIGKNQRYGLNIYTSYRPTVKFNVYFNGGANYSKLEANNGYSITNEGFNYRGSLGLRWVLWKDGSVNVNGGMYSPNIMLQGKSSTFFYTSLGASQYLLNRKMMLSVSASDPFWHKKKYTYDSKDATFYVHNETSYLAQTVRFSVTYNFGKMNLNVKKARRGIQNDDVKSGGGGSSQGEGSSN